MIGSLQSPKEKDTKLSRALTETLDQMQLYIVYNISVYINCKHEQDNNYTRYDLNCYPFTTFLNQSFCFIK